jgi:perosamine synthetase
VTERIPVAGPWITELEERYAADAAANAWYTRANEYAARFEKAFAAYVGRRYAISLPSCTSGLHLALAALGIGPGDEVIVPDATWIATSAPVSYVGASPVFADIDPITWCLSPLAVEANVSARTRAVIVVDLYGGLPDMDAIADVCHRHNLFLIEDAAEAIGAEHHGRRAGSFGAASAFSLHGSKTVTCGEGGVLVMDDSALFDRVRLLRDHGRVPGDKLFENVEVGFKYRMSAVQAAVALAQIERVNELVERKREIFGWYAELLRGHEGLTLNFEPEQTVNAYWMVTIVLDPSLGLSKRAVIAALDHANIDSRPFFNPLSSLAAYAGSPAAERGRQLNATTYRLSPYGVNLPSALRLTRDDVVRVCDTLAEVLRGQPLARASARIP